MFKVGDEVVWMGHDGTHWLHGGVYKVTQVSSEHFFATNRNGNPQPYPHIYMTTGAWKLHRHAVKLAAPKNDIEWLDRVQQNFKE